MLNFTETSKINDIVKASLNRAESIFKNSALKVQNADGITEAVARTINTNIPGAPFIDSNSFGECTLFSVMADMRDSSRHLIQRSSANGETVFQLERLYYEVSALVPVLCYWLNSTENEGRVTEILGDGVLALYKTTENGDGQQLTRIHGLCEKCISSVDVINLELKRRYNLMPIEIGIGISFSDAVVQTFGIPPHEEPKAFGECIYRSSKLSKGRNSIYLCESSKLVWPTSPGGKFLFESKPFGDVKGYLGRMSK